MISARDSLVFEEWATQEENKPSDPKINGNSIVYRSRAFQRKRDMRGFGFPILCDLGEARIGEVHEGLIQPDLYRAPEVILGMKWTSKVDIWNVGVLV